MTANPTPNSYSPDPNRQWNPTLGRWENAADGTYYDSSSRTWRKIEPLPTSRVLPPTAYPPAGSYVPGKVSEEPRNSSRVLDKRTTILVALGLLVALALLVTIALVNRDDGSASTSNGYAGYSDAALSGEDGYIDALEDRGLWNRKGRSGMLETGYNICALKDYGFTNSQIVAELSRDLDNGLDASDVRYVVEAAEKHLC